MKNVKEIMQDRRFMKETEKNLKDFGFIEGSEEITTKKRILSIVKFGVIILEIIVIIILSARLIININNSTSGGTISCNIVAEKGSSHPAFLGYTFTKDLEESIERGDIDLYGLYIAKPATSDSIDSYIYETKDAIPGTASRIKIVKVEYIEYTDEYIHKYFAEGHEPSQKGYYNYTIGLV